MALQVIIIRAENAQPLGCKPHQPSKLVFFTNRPNHDVMVLTAFLIIYILGGLTFVPLIICLVVLHAYFAFPKRLEVSFSQGGICEPGDDSRSIKSFPTLTDLEERFQRQHEGDVASGYFAVCRAYVNGGVNGKPPERTTPAGTVIAAESPSVYQNLYRSIFDRKQGPSLDLGKSSGKSVKRARNVFFVVLRHGHLMLYDDSEQVDPRHVIFLEHYDVSIYGGKDAIPEGELFIKKNSVRLSRKPHIEEGATTTKPFYFFSENCSEKEDFYFALLQNQEARPDSLEGSPRPQRFDVKHMITLVQQLHSSEEHLQTRWINGLIGRLFLALYKTEQIEDFIRRKITKKIARVKKPAFLSGIILQKIDMGEGAPYITNPKLKDLTVDGDCCAEADFMYSGNFRIVIGATARIDLGTRFKAREVNLVLAVVLKRVEGHTLIKFKPPPSNRVWVSFESMPDIEMAIEPIVSSRQITYSFILRAIESRIREVIAETLVLPHWDDSPFLDTTNQSYRGGIWATPTDTSMQPHTRVPDEVVQDETEGDTAIKVAPTPSPRSKDDRTMSLPSLPDSVSPDGIHQKGVTSTTTPLESNANKVPTGPLKKGGEAPRIIRTHSFASAADPLVSMDNANVSSAHDGTRHRKYSDATSAMMAISHRSPPTSPTETPSGSLPNPLADHNSGKTKSSNNNSISSISSKSNSIADHTVTSTEPSSLPPTPTSTDSLSITSSSATHTYPSTTLQADTRMPPPGSGKRYTAASLGAATAAAKKWGWGVLSRNNDPKPYTDRLSNHGRPGTPDHPIGRGRPLPPPGQPLPLPDRKTSQVTLPKRKPVPAPLAPQARQDEAKPRSEKPPPLPKRRRKGSVDMETASAGGNEEGMLVVQAPAGSEPVSPMLGAKEAFLEGAEADGKEVDVEMGVEEKGVGYLSPSVEDAMEDDEPTPTSVIA